MQNSKWHGLLALCKRLLLLAAVDFLMNDRWTRTCFDYEHNKNNLE